MKSPRRPASAVARGFVLPLTVWILAAVAIVASFLAERVQKSLQLAQSRQNLNAIQIELGNARADLLFRLATHPMSGCGLVVDTCIALDGRPYQAGSTVLRLQDARGLLNLNRHAEGQLDRLLAGYGVPAADRARLVDALADYIDADSLRRLNGAEEADYRARDLQPPRNAALLSPLELKAVLGWAETRVLWSPPAPLLPIDQLVTVGNAVALNPNTAPAQVLQAVNGVTPEVAQAVVARRQLEPVSADLLDALVGGGLIQFPPVVIAFPSSSVQVTQSAPGLQWALRYNVRLTPQDDQSPWQITYFHRLESPADPARAAPVSSSALPARFPTRPSPAASAPGVSSFRAF